ncbi:forkhead box protein R2 [Psammomys obesus]|uniref:forkhead box protein R2 n=1 Tax=Psammomys obesus TaxID=48139 RepID=UPI0024530811|nr:forkhead box protein R2 [Psammomys obesus]
MNVNLKDRAFWYSLHGQVPGMLDWDMGNECFLPCTTDQCTFTEQCLAKYKIQLIKPPTLPQERKPNSDEDGPPTDSSLWMWVNPNIVCPIISNETPNPCHNVPSSAPLPNTKEAACLGTRKVAESLSVLRTERINPQELSIFSTDPDTIEKEAGQLECPPSRKHSKKHKQGHGVLDMVFWPRPPLNYSHLVALALKNSPSCGLNVQQIYNFTRQHFPYFRTAPEGWKNTIRHNLCSLTCFEKVPVPREKELDGKPRSFFWKLTEVGNRFFQEDTRVLAYTRKENIKQCMCQPELIDLLFHF